MGTITGTHGQHSVAFIIRQVKRQHRHPCVHLYLRPGAELPGDPVEQVRTHRQMPVREVQFAGHAIAIRVCKGLQKYRIDLHGFDPVQQQIKVGAHLHRVSVIDVIQVDMGRTQRRLSLSSLTETFLGQIEQRRKISFRTHQLTVNDRIAHTIGQTVQGHGQWHVHAPRDLVGLLVVRTIGPDHDSRRQFNLLREQSDAALQVGADTRLILGIRFIARLARQPGMCGGSRQLVALGVGQHAAMHVMGV